MFPIVYICNAEDFTEIEIERMEQKIPKIYEETPMKYRLPEDIKRHRLGLLLVGYTCQVSDLPQITFSRSKYGKPFIKELPLFHFNISHSGKYIICATGKNEIGADIQKMDFLKKDYWYLFMNKEELDSCQNHEQALRIWSAKEAISKYIGCGFLKNVQDIGVQVCSDPIKITTKNRSITLWQYQLEEKYILSICSARSDAPQIRRFFGL